MNSLQFYDESGQLIYRVGIPSLTQPVTSITWGHNDKRVFVATGNQVHVGWITWPNVASLQLLTRYYTHITFKGIVNRVLFIECSIQCPLDIATLDIAAALPIATSTPVTKLRQYINSDLG